MATASVMNEIVEAIRETSPSVRPEDAAEAVLCVLSQRLSGGEARDLSAELPEELRSAIRVCVPHDRGARAPKWDIGEFRERVAQHLAYCHSSSADHQGGVLGRSPASQPERGVGHHLSASALPQGHVEREPLAGGLTRTDTWCQGDVMRRLTTYLTRGAPSWLKRERRAAERRATGTASRNDRAPGASTWPR